ncbi:Bifunctional nitrilase/nitrile hydratase NIT4 [Diplonema papillatum]|nr:Bifunctional nitrilase/nitrile hydratase NIT4 [Diplonema papillatum]KAJ9471849.1 Bifunctional nitrilase/nitrile hydratase NIT4 [Diplonema papillatum]
MQQAVCIERGDLARVETAAKTARVAVYLGTIERAQNRGGHSLYCSLVYINKAGEIQSVHRKLMPTYDERLTWAPGDGHGLRTHSLGAFTVGGLNCWENWMPLPRASLSAQGEDFLAVWPGSRRNTEDITRYMAKEGRSDVLSVSGLMRPCDFPETTPHRQAIIDGLKGSPYLAPGGSCLADPTGAWVIPPQDFEEGLYTATISHSKVREERQNFDPVGHYSRPDVKKLVVNRTRQSVLEIVEAKL